MIIIKQKGNFSKLTGYLERIKEVFKIGDLNKYGRQGVEALKASTPRRTGKTAESWSYEISHEEGRSTISFNNSNIQNGVNIAIILDYGHGTRGGGYVQGRNYIEPSLRKTFDDLAADAWKEVKRV